ncbi:Nucleoside diphosphate kinase 7, partial [Operophtera brumata]
VYDYFDKYTFLCEMFDEELDAVVDLVLDFFPFDNSVQVVNPKKEKKLLRRIHLPPLKLEMLQIGNILNIFSKLLYVRDCAPLTRRLIFNKVESTFAVIKPVDSRAHGKIITYITQKGFRIVRMKNGKITKEFAMELYKSIVGNSMLPIIIDYMTSGEVIGLELVAPEAVKKWRSCLGATEPAEAAPGTLRRLYGENKLKNVAHGTNTLEEATEMLELFFGNEKGAPRIAFRATLKGCTCCVIKSHAIIEGNVGAILEQISNSGKFYISAMAMFPDLCRQLYPDSLRAQYGKTIVHNAVHCTDLPEDGESEVEYFFKLIANDND